jgi:hypothetical protein
MRHDYQPVPFRTHNYSNTVYPSKEAAFFVAVQATLDYMRENKDVAFDVHAAYTEHAASGDMEEVLVSNCMGAGKAGYPKQDAMNDLCVFYIEPYMGGWVVEAIP